MIHQIEEENKIKEEGEQTEPKPPSTSPTMATDTATQLQEQTTKLEKINISFSIWPPTQKTRDAVIYRLIETLSTESVLSKRYGTIPHDEASEIAKKIEDEAFVAASGSVKGDDDGIEILQGYSKEISKRMLAAVKSRSTPATDDAAEAEVSAVTHSEEISTSADDNDNNES